MQKEPKTAAEKKQRAYENKIRHFVLQNYGQLKTEVFSSDGNREYIKTVAEMTGLPKSDVIFIVQDTDSEGECAEKSSTPIFQNKKIPEPSGIFLIAGLLYAASHFVCFLHGRARLYVSDLPGADAVNNAFSLAPSRQSSAKARKPSIVRRILSRLSSAAATI